MIDLNLIDAINVYLASFYKILKVNLLDGSFFEIKNDLEKTQHKTIQDWLKDVFKSKEVIDTDHELSQLASTLLNMTDLKAYLEINKSLRVRYQRKINNKLIWFAFDVLTNKYFSDKNPYAYFYIHDIDKLFTTDNLELLKLRESCYIDSLTTLYNTKRFDEITKNFNEHKYNILFADLNSLKWINDNLGHDLGNEYIKNFGLTLKEYFPSECFRTGGDEFIVIDLLNTPEEFKKKLDELLDHYLKERSIRSVSIGYKCCINNEPLKDSLKEAEKMMIENKNKFYLEHTEIQRRISVIPQAAQEELKINNAS